MANNNEDINSPSFSLTEEQIADIKDIAERWKNAKKRTGDRNGLTWDFKKKYKDNPEAVELFNKCKNGNKVNPNFKRKIPKSEESKAKEVFAENLRNRIKDNFYLNNEIDLTDGMFAFDPNFNLPPYFWIRASKSVIPKVIDEGCNLKHAWSIAVGILNLHGKELDSMLRTTKFNDMKHVCNTILYFLNKYMLVTYKQLVEKNKQLLVQRKMQEEEQKKIEQEQQLMAEIEKHQDEGGEKVVQHDIGFDITGLL